MRKAREQRYQVGEYWLEQRDGSTNWYRAWYDNATKRTRRVSLSTGDFEAAKQKLSEFHASQFRPKQAPVAEIPLAWVLARYYEDHASGIEFAEQARIAIRIWADWWGERMISDVTLDNQREFIASLSYSTGYISRILMVGRAALRYAHKHGWIASAPFVMDVEGQDEKRQKEPKGRPLALREVAKLLDGCEEEHLWRFIILAINTMARPDAILDLHSSMVNLDAGYINLLPPGRQQTKKRRPIIPITDTLRPLLIAWGDGYYISREIRHVKARYAGASVVAERRRVLDVKTAWRCLRARCWPPILPPLPEDATKAERRARSLICGEVGKTVNPYSFRHTMGRELRRRRVPADEISIMLGHMPVNEHDTTAIYSPHDPDYCSTAKAAIDAFCADLAPFLTNQLRASYAPVRSGKGQAAE